MEINDLVGKDLGGFEITEFTEVYRIDEDGRRTKSLGFFKNEKIAKAFTQNQVESTHWYRTEKVFMITNGEIGFIIKKDSKKIFSKLAEEEIVLEIKNRALSKLSPEEIELLKI